MSREHTDRTRTHREYRSGGDPVCDTRVRLRVEQLDDRSTPAVLNVASDGFDTIFPMPITDANGVYVGDGPLTLGQDEGGVASLAVIGSAWTKYDTSDPPGILVNPLWNMNRAVTEFDLSVLDGPVTKAELGFGDTGGKGADDPDDPPGSTPSPNPIDLYWYVADDGEATTDDYGRAATFVAQFTTDPGQIGFAPVYWVDVTAAVREAAAAGAGRIGFRLQAGAPSVFEDLTTDVGGPLTTGGVLRVETDRPNLTAGPLTWNSERGIDYRYTVTGGVGAAEAGFYWATGPRGADAIREVDRVELAGAVGEHGPVNVAAHWGPAPAGTTHVLILLDPGDRVAETDELDNLWALPIHSAAEILGGALSVNVSGHSITASFKPGGEDTDGTGRFLLSEAAVVLGVDHFNWVQHITDAPDQWELIRRTGPETGEPLDLPWLDPDDQVARGNQIFLESESAGRGPKPLINIPLDNLPFYYNEPDEIDGNTVDDFMVFSDAPAVPADYLRPGEFWQFETVLVGVGLDGSRIDLPGTPTFTWKSNSVFAPDDPKATAVDGGIFLKNPDPDRTPTIIAGGVFDVRLSADVTPAPVAAYAVGAGAGGAPVVRVYGPDGVERFTVTAFDEAFTGGVRTAVADFSGDGVADLVVGTGPGAPTLVRVLDGVTRAELFAVAPFEPAFLGGVYVAAGDLTGDGAPDLVITPDEGGGPRVLVYRGGDFGLVANFFGIDDPNFRGGARPAVADLSGDGRADLVVAAGFGGGPRVSFYDGTTVTAEAPVRLFNDIFVFEDTLRNGAFVTAGDLDADGFADLIAGGGPGGGPRILAFSGAGLSAGRLENPTIVANFFAGNPDNRGGVRVAAKDLDSDDKADVVVGAGTDAGSRVTTYMGSTMSGEGPPPFEDDFDAFPGFAGGVFVG